ncbi:MAG: hypothetical protein WB760_15215 [Xanthobacteraceae bacterium]
MLVVLSLLAALTTQFASTCLAAWSDGAGMHDASPASIATPSIWASACFWIFACTSPTATNTPPNSAQATAADRVEKLYSGFAVGTDAQGNEGYNAAQAAEQQLLADFLSSFQNPQKNAANQTAWDQEQDQLLNDALKYAGSKALDAAATYWGETHLNLPVISPEGLIAQANTMQVSDQAGEREFDQYMANYLAVRFDTLNRLTGQYQTAISDIDALHILLDLADLQAELRIDEVARTIGKSKPIKH